MNKENLTEEILTLLKDKKGYRTELYGGSGERSLRDVVTFEIYQLNNSDIVLTMLDLYEDFKLSIDYEEENFDVTDLSEECVMTIIDDICKYVSMKSMQDESNIKVLWLATKEGVTKHYLTSDEAKNFDDFVDSYSLNDSSLVLSDLGSQGGLFVIS